MMIAITTPTGHIGRKLVKKLLDQGGRDLILLARDPKKLAEEEKRGAVVKQGDLSDAAYVEEATRGVDALFWLIPPQVQAPDVVAYYKSSAEIALNAVQKNRIKRVVLLSSVGAHLAEKTGPVRALHQAETVLKKTDAHVVFLRAGYFMENFLSHVPTLRQAGAIYLPLPGKTVLPFIATRDIADEAAALLADPQWTGKKVIELHGAADLSFDQVAAAIGRAAGKDVKHVQVTPEQAEEAMVKMGLGRPFAKEIIEMHVSMGNGRMKPERSRPDAKTTPTTFDDFAKEVLAPAIRGGAPASV